MNNLRQDVGKALMVALLVLSGAGLLLGQTAPGGGTLGVDTTGDTSASTAGLAAIWGANIPGGMAGVQNAVNMGGNTTAGTLPPAPDPYQRDASGNLVLDATGKPVKKPADQLAKETAAWQALCDQIKAAAALAASLSAAGQPGDNAYGGGISVPDSSVSSRAVPLTGPNWGAGMALDPSNPYVGYAGGHANLASTKGRPSGGGLWTAPWVPDLTTGEGDHGIGQAGVLAVAGLLGGAPGVPVIGNPSNPTIINMPVVCVCCGAALHNVSTFDKTYVGCMGYYLEKWVVLWVSSGAPTIEWVGPGVDPGALPVGQLYPVNGGGLVDAAGHPVPTFPSPVWSDTFECNTISGGWLGGSSAPPTGFTRGQAPLEEYCDSKWASRASYAFYGYPTATEIDGAPYNIQVCDQGHRQDWPCGPSNHDWGHGGGGGGKSGNDKGPGR